MRLELRYDYLFILVAFVSRSVLTRDLPGPNDTFQDIRANDKVYVDKSGYIPQLLQSENRFFTLCRPGRFGKTNFLRMLGAFFEGREQLFAGLAVNEHHDWRTSPSYPVIYLDFSTMNCSRRKEFKIDLKNAIVEVGRSFNIELDDDNDSVDEDMLYSWDDYHIPCETLLFDLIHQLSMNGTRNESVVILIDEYDWPLRPIYDHYYGRTHNYGDFSRMKDFQHFFNYYLFYGLMERQQYIKFLFCTCTAKMQYVNRGFPFELKDITYDAHFHTMIGLTGEELERDLRPHISAMVANTPNETFQTVVQRLRRRYNGYCFSPKKADTSPRLYNFHSVVSSLRDGNADYLWHPTADRKYDFVYDYSIHEIERYADQASLDNVLSGASFQVSRDTLLRSCACFEQLDMHVLMIIRGYLTFTGYNETTQEYTVAFPNEEMRESYRRAVLKIIRGGLDLPTEDFARVCGNLTRLMGASRSASDLIEWLNTLTFGRKDELRERDWLSRHSSDKIVALIRACDVCLRENSPSGADPPRLSSLVVLESVEKEYEASHYRREEQQRYAGLIIRLSDSGEYWFHFEFDRSAPCAVNVLLKKMSGRTDWPKERTFYLMGVNFRRKDDEIHEWIRITYQGEKFVEVQASHTNYLKMYAHVVNLNASSLVL